MSNLSIVLILGKHGSGKGTVCSKLNEEFGYPHISVGQLLRQQMNNPDNEDRELIKKHMMEGNVVPVEITCRILENEILQQSTKSTSMPNNQNTKFLIDGFPLNLSNQEGFDRILGDKMNLEAVIYLNCSEESCTKRMLARSRSSGRFDDTGMSTIKSRHERYLTESMPVVENYKLSHYFHEIDAEQEIEKVYQDVRRLFL